MLRVLAALIFRKLLLQKVRQGVVKAVLPEVRAGDTGRIVFGAQVIDLFQFRTIVTANDGGGVADLGVRYRRLEVRRQRGGR